MKKLTAVLSVALLVSATLASFVSTSDSASSFSNPIKVAWADGSQTTDLTDEADTTRTGDISTRDWDWETLMNGMAPGTSSPWAVAKIVFESNDTNWAGDSIYFVVEPSVDGGTTYASYPGLLGGNMAITSSIGNTAVLTPTTQTTPAQWVGYLCYDRDSMTPTPNNNLLGVLNFRLKVFGDVSGTTPTYNGLTCTIYPLRNSP